MYEKAEIIPPDSVCTACGCQEVTVRLFLGKRFFVVPRQYAASFLHILYRLQEKWKFDLYLYT